MEKLAFYAEITKSLAWPIATLLICGFFFKTEISKLLSKIRVSSLKAGSVELQFSEQLHYESFTKEQLKAITELTKEELNIFMVASYSNDPKFRYIPAIDQANLNNHLVQLEKAGLIEIQGEPNSQALTFHYTTRLGQKFRELIIESTSSLLRKAI